MDDTILLIIIIVVGAVFVFGSFFGLILLFKYKSARYQKTQPAGTVPPVTASREAGAAGAPEESRVECSPGPAGSQNRFTFSNVALSAGIALVSLVITLVFLPQLPEELAFRFSAGGTPVSYAPANTVMFFSLFLQAFFLGLGWATGKLVFKMFLAARPSPAAMPKGKSLATLCANMVALPQVILAFLTSDAFSYNVSGVHLMPAWLFIVIAMLAGGVIIAGYFVKIMRLN